MVWFEVWPKYAVEFLRLKLQIFTTGYTIHLSRAELRWPSFNIWSRKKRITPKILDRSNLMFIENAPGLPLDTRNWTKLFGILFLRGMEL